ncbi:MAG: outer membrane protein insertion porin family [Flavobacteriaceae bacterium]
MIQKFKHTTILLILIVTAAACKQTKYVPEGEYLLKKNDITLSGDKIDKADLNEIIRQQPNYKQAGIKWKLLSFNMVDSARIAKKRTRKNFKLHVKNDRKRAKQAAVNKKRVEEARADGDSLYTQKIIPLKDTISPRLFFREWFKYKIGSPPIVFDSIPYEKTLEQFDAYLRSKGYYYGLVNGLVRKKPNGKTIVTYDLVTGSPYIIDSVYLESTNPSILGTYNKYVSKLEEQPFIGQPFDADVLDDFRYDVAAHLRNSAYYGFSTSHITFRADTNFQTMKVCLGVLFQDRLVRPSYNSDTLISIKHRVTYVRDVYFHIADTSLYEGNFQALMDSLQLSLKDGQFMRTTKSLVYEEVKKPKSDEINPYRIANFNYNGELFLKPKVLEDRNYLEKENYYKGYYVERSYKRLLELGLFQSIKTVLEEVEGTNQLDVHYYLVPSKRQSFGIEPQATNSNGFLGVSATINYTNRNLFRGGEKLTLAFSGGFESQPPIFDETLDGNKIQTAGRSFNTFEFGPSLKFEVPSLFPSFLKLSKRHRPRTEISAAYNFQKRDAFTRGTFQLNYNWNFYVLKTQIFHVGLPFASVIKFVNIEKSTAFDQTLTDLNDLFLLNSYSDQFVWQDWKFTFEYSFKDGLQNVNKKNKKTIKRGVKTQIYINTTFDAAGNMLSLFKGVQDTLLNGQRTIFGVGYSQFSRLDNELIVSQPLGKGKGIHFHLNAGGGVPHGNSVNSLPYDYSFFAGGANDNRGWRARALGPGTYKYYLDTNRTATQIGDIRVGGSLEYRFAFSSALKGAFFLDAGNIWTIGDDINRVGGQISKDWYKEFGVAAGFGLRLDLDFFIVRVDLGIPVRNPALPKGAQWFFQPRTLYEAEGALAFPGNDANGNANYLRFLPAPFVPQVHFGIGYPF